ncbi:efflux RND transporter permease subunit [uncultured Thiodictyon sp.]|uniref:efflux RND transporter permease subunit n=1 Tax=uncultured Thiodictyon sp. TaxID=1846217 RepID=UPI0025ED6839|nr:efflux RND transporter permease subunit [uncultured Thiodictyon sp.]
MTEPKLNLAGLLARGFITSKLTSVFILGVTVLGLATVLLTPREENPQILVPGVQVMVSLPGASAKEVEALVVTPLEGLLSSLSQVDHTYGIAQTAVGSVQVQFKVGQPKEGSLVKVYDRILSNRVLLPADAGVPHIRSVDADDVPIVTLTLASPRYDDFALKRLADRMAERLRSLDDVSVVAVRGGQGREFSVELEPERLQAFGVSLIEARAAFASSNLSLPLAPTVRDEQVQAIKLQGFFTTADDVRDQIVATREGRPIYVRDIATVTDGAPSEIARLSRFAFGSGDARFSHYGAAEMPAVTIAVAKKKGANAVVVADAIGARIARMQASFVPPDVAVVMTRNDGQKANAAVNGLMEHLGVAAVSVSLILVLFLGWREALIVTVTVPLIFFVTLAADLFGGVTINRVTLFALILSLGLLVDAAIVVIENIHRHYGVPGQQNQQHVTIVATNEIGNATNLATLAVMLVFGSLFLVTGMAGAYFYPIAFNVPIAMAASVVVAYSVTPWAANRWLRCKTTGGRGISRSTLHHNGPPPAKASTSSGCLATPPQCGRPDLLQRLYHPVMTILLERRAARRALALLVLLLMLGSVLQGAWQFIRPAGITGPQSMLGVNLGFMLKDNKNTFNLLIAMPETTPVEQTARLVRDLTRQFQQDPNVVNLQSWIGQAGVADFNGLLQGTADREGSQVAEIRVNLVDKQERRSSSIELVRQWRTRVDAIRLRYPGARVRLVEDAPGPPMRATVLAQLHGPDPDGLRALSAKVSQAFAATYDLVDLWDSEPVDVIEHRIVPDKEKAALSKVSVAQIAQSLSLVYGGEIVSRAHPADEKNPVDVRVLVPRRYAVDPTRLERILIDNADGKPVPLSELVRVEEGAADRPIQHQDNERVSYVGGELAQSVALYAVLDLNRRLAGIMAADGQPLTTGNLTFRTQAPDVINGYQVLWDGEVRLMLDIYRDMGVALGAALAMIYLVLVAYYRSFLIPLIAMSAVPLGIIGIFPGHWLMGADFTATSLVGIIALSGVVIRNSLLIIDFIQDNQRRGQPLAEAVKQAGAVRLRPILLTTLAIVLGSAIMLTDPVFGGLAISLIFGTLAATVLTVVVVPVLFYLNALRAPSTA